MRWGGSQLCSMATPPWDILLMDAVLRREEGEEEEDDLLPVLVPVDVLVLAPAVALLAVLLLLLLSAAMLTGPMKSSTITEVVERKVDNIVLRASWLVDVGGGRGGSGRW